jgi:hypothetical protein
MIHATRPEGAPSTLVLELKAGLARFEGQARILLATADRTAQAFEAGWDASDERVIRCPGATHAWVEPDAREFLDKQILAVLRD